MGVGIHVEVGYYNKGFALMRLSPRRWRDWGMCSRCKRSTAICAYAVSSASSVSCVENAQRSVAASVQGIGY